MTGPSRRDALFGVDAGGLELTPFLRPAKAAPAADVGPIEAGYVEFEKLARAHDEACEATWAAEEHYVEPERPGWHPAHDEGGYRSIETSPGRGIVVLDDRPENVARLREIIGCTHEPDTEEWGPSNKIRGRRARKTLAKIEAWQAEVRSRKDAAGITKAEQIEERAGAAARIKAQDLLAIEPGSYREAAFLAAIIEQGSYDDEDVDIRRLTQSLIRLAGIRLYWRTEDLQEA